MNRERFDRLLEDNHITEKEDSFAYNVFCYWYEENANATDKSDNCLTYKLKEYTFCRESKDLDLPFTAVMNWADMFGADIFLRTNPYSYIAADYKYSSCCYHPYKKNTWGITAHNSFSLKLQQVEDYCRDGLRYIICDRDITLESEENQKAAHFLKRYNWGKDSLVIEEKRSIIIIEVKRLCKLLGDEEEIIYQTVPQHKRNEQINGKNWDGRTIFFNYNIWPSIDVASPSKKENRATGGEEFF